MHAIEVVVVLQWYVIRCVTTGYSLVGCSYFGMLICSVSSGLRATDLAPQGKSRRCERASIKPRDRTRLTSQDQVTLISATSLDIAHTSIPEFYSC